MPTGMPAITADRQSDGILPDHPAHPDHERYRQVLTGVERIGRWSPDQARDVAFSLYANVAANPTMKRVDEVALGLGDSPQVFAIYRPFGENPPAFHCCVPLDVAARTCAREAVAGIQSGIDRDGYLTASGVTRRPVPELEHGQLQGPHAIVMHRTGGATAQGALNAFASGTGTHFLVDKDGTIYQTASLEQKTWHVGKIKSRCYEEGTCAPEETRELDAVGFNPSRVHGHEKSKPYPLRYPMNDDSVGIEVVARHTDQGWESPTPQQTASIRRLVGILQQQYGLGERDVYEHDIISYKTRGEGAGLYQPDDRSADPPVVPPGGPSR